MNSSNKTTRQANWLSTGKEEIFYWHHMPEEKSSDTAVIIISPFGPEYMHCSRSVKILADHIAATGFHCVRYDPPGMGNSSADLEDENIWLKWLEAPQSLTQHLNNKFNIKNIILLGLRSGCLVMSELLKSSEYAASIFWYPHTRGSHYIRGIQLLDSVLYENDKVQTGGTLDGGGYPITESLQTEIKKINLLKQDFAGINKTLVINDKETTSKSKLNEHLLNNDINTESIYLEGLDAMIKQVALSKVPFNNIDTICSWLKHNFTDTPRKSEAFIAEQRQYKTRDFCESIVRITSPRNIFGILTIPESNNKNRIVIIVNTGAAHHAGPNRFHVETARILALKGITTLRIDLSNLGDSIHDDNQEFPDEFPASSTEDINAVMSFVSENIYKEIILCGLCAGAHNIFHAALNSNNTDLKKLILINPETFYYNPEQSELSSENPQTEVKQVYYQQQLFNPKKWLALLTNPEKLLSVSKFLFLFIIKKSKILFRKLLRLVNINIKTTLETDIARLADKGIVINLVYSKGDPGYAILMAQAAGLTRTLKTQGLYESFLIEDADHTFSSKKSRQSLYSTLLLSLE